MFKQTFILASVLLALTGEASAQTCPNFYNPLVRVEVVHINANGYKSINLYKTDSDSPVKFGHMAVFTAPYGTPNRKQIGITNVGFMRLGMNFGEGPWYVDATDENTCGGFVEWERDVAILDNRVQ